MLLSNGGLLLNSFFFDTYFKFQKSLIFFVVVVVFYIQFEHILHADRALNEILIEGLLLGFNVEFKPKLTYLTYTNTYTYTYTYT